VRDRGACLVLVSYDLDEIRALSDRIVVFSEGRISGTVTPERADDVTMGRLMAGAAADG
jgi:simple sugar transport system ATP-binding protein